MNILAELHTTTRTVKSAKDSEKNFQDKTARTREPGQIARTGLLGQDSQDRTARTRLLGQDCQDRLPGQDARKGQQGHEF
jgi:hypothetical protein